MKNFENDGLVSVFYQINLGLLSLTQSQDVLRYYKLILMLT